MDADEKKTAEAVEAAKRRIMTKCCHEGALLSDADEGHKETLLHSTRDCCCKRMMREYGYVTLMRVALLLN